MVSFLNLASLYAASQATFTLIPTTPTTVQIPVNGSATVQYNVTNQTKVTRTLTMVPIAGVTQLTGTAGECLNPFMLASKQSCLLTLQLKGSQLPEHIMQGPVVCKTQSTANNSPDRFLCSQPSQIDSLNITRLGVEQGTVSVAITAGSPLTLQPSFSTGNMTIINNSLTEYALNIAANFTGTALSGNVSQTASTCSSVAPGASCTLTFTPGATLVAQTDFLIQGSNTTAVTGAISIASLGPLAYVVSSGSSTVSKCPVNSDGTFGACANSNATGVAFSFPIAIALNSTKTLAYVTNQVTQSVVICPINSDGTFGTCTDSGNTVVAFNSPRGIVFNSAGTRAYVVNTNAKKHRPNKIYLGLNGSLGIGFK